MVVGGAPHLQAALGNQVVTLTFSDLVPGRRYVLEVSNTLLPGGWQAASTLSADSSVTTLTIPLQPNPNAVFYRLKQEP